MLANKPQLAARFLRRSVYRAYEPNCQGAAGDIALRTAIRNYDDDTTEGAAAWLEERPATFNNAKRHLKARMAWVAEQTSD